MDALGDPFLFRLGSSHSKPRLLFGIGMAEIPMDTPGFNWYRSSLRDRVSKQLCLFRCCMTYSFKKNPV